MSDTASAVSGKSPADHPPRLNLGCGFDKRPGYLNVDFQDFHDPDLVADVRDLGMLDSGKYVEIVAQDVLEHLERADVAPTLAEWARLLSPGGILVLRVPDLIGLAKVMATRATVSEHELLIQNLYGTQAYSGDYHQSGFTELTLRHELHRVGLVVRSIVHKDGWLFDCEAEKVDVLGPFDPGPLPFLRLCDHDAVEGNNERGEGRRGDSSSGEAVKRPTLPDDAGVVDRVVAAVGGWVPASLATRARTLWRPLRRKLAERGIL